MSEHIQARAMCESNSLRDSIKGLNDWVAEMKLKETKLNNIEPAEVCHLNALNLTILLIANLLLCIFPQAFGKTDPIRNHIHANGDSLAHTIDPSKLEQADKFKQSGNELVKRLKYHEAIKCYSDAIEINAEDPVFYLNRALCFLKLNQYKDCIEDCTRALRFDKKLIKAYYRRGTAYEYSGELVAAERDYLSVLEHDPLNVDGKRSLAYVKQLLEEYVKLKEQCVSNKRRSWSRYQQESDYTPVDFQLKSRRMQSEQHLRSIQIKKSTIERKPEGDRTPTVSNSNEFYICAVCGNLKSKFVIFQGTSKYSAASIDNSNTEDANTISRCMVICC